MKRRFLVFLLIGAGLLLGGCDKSIHEVRAPLPGHPATHLEARTIDGV